MSNCRKSFALFSQHNKQYVEFHISRHYAEFNISRSGLRKNAGKRDNLAGIC